MRAVRTPVVTHNDEKSATLSVAMPVLQYSQRILTQLSSVQPQTCNSNFLLNFMEPADAESVLSAMQ
jgi:hypothetical protein